MLVSFWRLLMLFCSLLCFPGSKLLQGNGLLYVREQEQAALLEEAQKGVEAASGFFRKEYSPPRRPALQGPP